MFEYDDAELAWTGKGGAWFEADEKVYIEHAAGENRIFRPTPPTREPYIPIEHSGRMDRVEMYMPRAMTDAEAAGTDALPEPAAGAAPVATPEPTREEQILSAVTRIDSSNPRLMTRSGKPRVVAVKREAGFRVSGAERDDAWHRL